MANILSVLDSTDTGDTAYQVWFELDYFWPHEKDLALKLIVRINRKSPYEKLSFFLGKLYQKVFLF